MAFYKTNEEQLKNKLVAPIKDSTRLTQLVCDIRAEVIDLEKRLDSTDGVNRSVVVDSCASYGLSLRQLVENFRAGLNKSASEAFCVGSIKSQFFADDSIDGLTLRLSEEAASDDSEGSTKNKDC